MAVRGWSTTERWQRERAWYERQERVDYIKTSAMLPSGKAGRLAISRAWLAVYLSSKDLNTNRQAFTNFLQDVPNIPTSKET